jgi:outer membrane receptor protein involved in Fe transport
LTAGAAYDASRVSFNQSTQLGFLNPDRSVTGLNAFGDGVTGGSVDGAPFDTRVDLDGRIRTWSVYATDTLSIGDAWHLTLSGRYNRTSITNTDQINPGGGPGSLDGSYVFDRFNPAIGVTFVPGKALNAYVGYNEGSRAPTAIELGCADPNNPCRLSNSMAGDPPLKQVVTKTWEAGLHGLLANGARWNAGVFRAENQDDILFVASPDQSQFGFFKNFGKTRREGLEAGLSGKAGPLALGANYTYLDATYQSLETVNGSSNSSNATAAAGAPGLSGTIQIRPGDRIPLVPQHIFKAYADYQVNAAFALGLNLVAVGSSYARGNENNAHEPDGVNYLGPGKSPGYGVLNLSAQYDVDPKLKLFAQVNNLLDHKYSTGALLGPTGFTANGNFIARPLPAIAGEFPVQHATFYAPGAPRIFWIGLRYRFDTPPRTR